MIEIIFILIVLFIFFFGLKYYVKSRSPEYKGFVGESIVSTYLMKLPENEYKIINNVYLRVKNNSVQIDHLIISIYGIFVIETKNYSGWIFGSDNNNYWTQVIYRNKYKFKNPVKQNLSHINVLKYILSEYKLLKYFSIIVFTGSVEFKSINSLTPVIYESQLFNYILRSNEEQIINYEQMNKIISKIHDHIINDEDIEQKHIQNVYNKKYENIQKINEMTCPKCNGTLLIRDGIYGKFYGCSNYPKCRFTLKY